MTLANPGKKPVDFKEELKTLLRNMAMEWTVFVEPGMKERKNLNNILNYQLWIKLRKLAGMIMKDLEASNEIFYTPVDLVLSSPIWPDVCGLEGVSLHRREPHRLLLGFTVYGQFIIWGWSDAERKVTFFIHEEYFLTPDNVVAQYIPLTASHPIADIFQHFITLIYPQGSYLPSKFVKKHSMESPS